MGVDAGFFERKSKKYFWFDRLSNIQKYWDLDISLKEHEQLQETFQRLVSGMPVGVEDIKALLNANIDAWMKSDPDQQYHAVWCKDCLAFVEAYPDGDFFVASDHGNAYDYIGEMNGETTSWTGLFMQWKPRRS